MKKQPTPGEWIVLAAGALMLVFAFTPFYSSSGDDLIVFDPGLFPIAALLPLYGVLAASHVALARFGNVQFPPRMLGCTWPQFYALLGVFATLLSFAYLISDKGGFDIGVGLIFELLGSIALVVGGALILSNTADEATA